MKKTVLTDATQREQGRDPTRSLIVQAPAGSGKTELLTQRYLALLAKVHEPEEIIAITFTRKAAGEMRARLLNALRKGHQQEAPAAEHERVAWHLARQALQRDQERNWQLEHNPARLRIQTIDSLCAGLTRQMPLLASFGAQPALIEDATALYRQAARHTLDELESGADWSPAVEALLSHLDNDMAKVEAMLMDMLARRDQWLRHIVNSETQQRDVLELGLQNLIRDALEALPPKIPSFWQERWLALARFAAANLKAEEKCSDIVHCLELKAFPGTGPDDLDAWRGLIALLLTQDGAWRKSCTAQIGFPAPSSEKEDKARKALLSDHKAAFAELIAALSENEDLRCALKAVRELPPPYYTDEQWALMQALFELLPLAVAQLNLVFQSQQGVDFSEMAQRAIIALGGEEAPTDLALALDYRIKHILVDEFQDTSLGQIILLERLTAGWQSGDGRTLFAVGDPMQSIYRFREAEVGLYLRSRHQGIGALKLAPLTLSVNFRSQGGIIDWINAAFSQIFPRRENIGQGAVPYTPSQAYHPPLAAGAVQIHPLLGRNDQREAQRVVDLIREARAADESGVVAVLVRNRTHLVEIIPALKRAELAFRAIEIDSLGQKPGVQDLLALTKALHHMADRLSWLAVLRAPWCGLKLADLLALVEDRPERTVWDLLQQDLFHLSAEGQRRAARLVEALKPQLAQRLRVPLRRHVEAAWIALGGPAAVIAESDLEDAEVFLSLLDRFDRGGGLADFAALERAVDGLYAPPDLKADERLQIMTIHKAKGLEFDTVILPGLGRRQPFEQKRLLHWLERPRGDGSADLLLAPVAKYGKGEDSTYKAVQALELEKGYHENARLLYVAATRAKKQLHLIGHVELDAEEAIKPPAKSALLASLWPAVEGDFLKALPNAKGAAKGNRSLLPCLPYIRRLNENWRFPPPPPPIGYRPAPRIEPVDLKEKSLLDGMGEAERHSGTVIHSMLERMGRESLEKWTAERLRDWTDRFAARLINLGLSARAIQEAVERVEAALINTLNDARGRWILSSDHTDARCQFPLTGIYQGKLVNIVIDRTFVDKDGLRWIIDYKTAELESAELDRFLDSEQNRYRAQLECYAALMSQWEKRPIRVGLYLPSVQGWREWAFSPGAGLTRS